MDHIAQIAGKLADHQLDAMLLASQAGERYAVGFHGEGLVLVTREGAHYSTDSRYIEAARQEVQGAQVELVTRERGHLALAAGYLQEHGLKRVGFESGAVSVDALARYERALPCTLVPAQDLPDGLRASKDGEELAAMEKAQRITDEAFQAILNFIRPGQTEREVAARLVYELLRRGGERVSFDPIVAAGANGSKPHAVPGDTVIQPGMFVTMDFGCVWRGYCSDMTRTVALGEPTGEMRKVYQTVLEAQLAGIAVTKAGVPGKSIDAAARKVIEDAGYGEYFGHGYGHSLGIEIHESPNANTREETLLPVGAVVSAEPGIYLPGKFGVRIEDVTVLTADGCMVLTKSPKELIIL